MMQNKGFTLIELLVTILIIGVVATIASIPALTLVQKNKLNNDVTATMQIIQEAQNYSTTRSTTVVLDFSDPAKVVFNNENGEEMNSYEYQSDIYYSSEDSTITSDIVTYNFKGSPLGADGEVTSFEEANGMIALCYRAPTATNCKYTKSIKIAPVTGVPTLD